jgi:hypothetical protein
MATERERERGKVNEGGRGSANLDDEVVAFVGCDDNFVDIRGGGAFVRERHWFV